MGTAAEPALRRVVNQLRRRGLVVFVSDLLLDRDLALKALRFLRHRGHQVLVLHLMDPAEVALGGPAEARFEDPETRAAVVLRPRDWAGAYRDTVQRRGARVAARLPPPRHRATTASRPTRPTASCSARRSRRRRGRHDRLPSSVGAGRPRRRGDSGPAPPAGPPRAADRRVPGGALPHHHHPRAPAPAQAAAPAAAAPPHAAHRRPRARRGRADAAAERRGRARAQRARARSWTTRRAAARSWRAPRGSPSSRPPARQVLARATPDDALWLLAADGVPRAGRPAGAARPGGGAAGLLPPAGSRRRARRGRRGARRPSRARARSRCSPTCRPPPSPRPIVACRSSWAGRTQPPPANVGIARLETGPQPWGSDGGRLTVSLVGRLRRRHAGERAARHAPGPAGARPRRRRGGARRCRASPSGWWNADAELDPDELRLDDRRVGVVRVAPVARVNWDSRQPLRRRGVRGARGQPPDRAGAAR